MDLYVERQCIDNMKKDAPKQFILLYDDNFVDVYKYVLRRVSDLSEAERIVRLTFLDAFGQMQSTPTDISYLVWLYSLAKPRVWDYIAKDSVPEKRGLISVKEAGGAKSEVEKAERMFAKLSMEEREILRLKLFEEVNDGDVMTVLGMEEGVVGPKIYRVLKRAHFLLFGQSEERQGVYFGELSGFIERLKRKEEIEIPEVFKLSLKTDIAKRIDRKDFAVSGEVLEEEKGPFKVKDETVGKGSSDPAKIFVEAVNEMREEEEKRKVDEVVSLERRERLYDFIDRWKSVLALVPVILFIFVVAVVVKNLFDFDRGLERGYPTLCSIEVGYEGEFYDGLRRSVDRDISDKLCDYYEERSLGIFEKGDGSMNVLVDVEGWDLEYGYVNVGGEWRIQKYERKENLDSYDQSGEVS
ncbi:MAG: hypothetical protein V1679_02385 [Candidatus Peregrinibacteria bacterium]